MSCHVSRWHGSHFPRLARASFTDSLDLFSIDITLHYVILIAGWDHFDANEVGFKELYQMFQLVTEQLGQEAIVVDADDLLKNPGQWTHCSTMSKSRGSFCGARACSERSSSHFI